MVLAEPLVARFAPTGPILLGRDDTLCRKRGLTLFCAGMHHDPLMSSKALKVFRGGHDWVVLFLLRPGSAWAPTQVFAWPVGFRLCKNRQGLAQGRPKAARRPTDPNHRTRPQRLVELLRLFAEWFPDRQIIVSADSVCGGKSVLQKLPAGVDLLGRIGERKKATPAQIALAWLLAQKPWIVPIPGTTKLHRLDENIGAAAVELTPNDLREIENAASKITVQGDRYPERLEQMTGR